MCDASVGLYVLRAWPAQVTSPVQPTVQISCTDLYPNRGRQAGALGASTTDASRDARSAFESEGVW